MFSLIIADDELHQRQGLAHYVHWASLGYELKGCFADGEELLRYLENNPTDVVFTDINMSPVSGLDIAKYVHQNHLQTSVVFISGYKEFEFAQKALEYSVHGYITKPAQIEDICRIFKELAATLAGRARTLPDEALSVMRRHFLDDLMFGYRMNNDELEAKLAELRLPAGLDSPAAVLGFGAETLQSPQVHALRGALNEAIRRAALPRFADMVYNHGGHCVAVLLGPSDRVSGEAWQAVAAQWAADCARSALEGFGLELSGLRVEVFPNLSALNRAYQSRDSQPTPAALSLAFPKGEGAVRTASESVSDQTIQKARRYIDENFAKDISLDEVADYVHLNPIYFSRFFKQKTGENFISYLVALRMARAIELLKSSDYKVYEISELVGYKSVKYFSRVFKQTTGYSPADYAQLANVLAEQRT